MYCSINIYTGYLYLFNFVSHEVQVKKNQQNNCQNNCKIEWEIRRNRSKNNVPNIDINDRPLS